MSALQPMAVYALKVDPGEELVAAMPHFASMFRITMAAIDPSEDPDAVDIDQSTMTQRSTLKLVRFGDDLFDEDDSDDEDFDEDDLMDDDEDEDGDEEVNGGPSDKKLKRQALLEALAADEAEEDMEEDEEGEEDDSEADEADEAEAIASLKALTKKVKGKNKAIDGEDQDEEEDDSEIESDEGIDLDDMTEMAICTLDTKSHYQQPLDLTIQENERVFFRVVGSHPVYITGNYVIPPDYANAALLDEEYEDGEDDDDDDEYDLSPDEEEIDGLDALLNGGSESDELDDMDDPRVAEVGSEEDTPKLTKAAPITKKEDKSSDKGKNKRLAEDSDENDEPALDDIMEKSLKREETTAKQDEPAVNSETKKLSKAEKKKLKKLKKNDGTAADAVPSSSTLDGAKETVPEKKVQFDKNLVKGPTPNGDSKPSPAADNKTVAPSANGKSASVREVNGVTIDDRKLGNGPAAKKGNKLDMRYIGKLDDGKVFDSNKSGKPFTFKLGTSEVIKGWDIGLEGIKAGGERRIIVPAHLAYGKKGVPGIPSNSRLTFDIKCLGVK